MNVPTGSPSTKASSRSTAFTLAQDRRKNRYVRLRRAMKQGAEPHEVVKVPRKPSADDEALDQALGDELVARLSRRRR